MNRKGLLIRGLISICLLAALFFVVDFSSLVNTLKGTRLGFSLAVILLALCDRVFMAFKWNVLLRAIGVRISFFESVRTYFASSFASIFLGAGSEVMRLFIVGAEKGRRESVAASIVVERLVAFMALVLLFIIMSTCALFYLSFERIGVVVAVAVVVFVVSACVFFISLYHVPVSALDRFTGKLGDVLRKFLVSYQMYRDKKAALALFFGLSFVENFFPILCNYFVALALGLPVNPFAFFVVIPIVLIFARLPISLEGLGVQEGLYLLLFPMAGLSMPDSMAIALLARILTILALLPGGIMFIFHPGRRDLEK